MTHLAGPVRPLILAFAVLAGLALTARQTPAASNFDGEWSVLIITEAGSCDRAYRYPVKVTNGVLTYEGEASVEISGRVDQSGKISAMVQRGQQHANGSGKLSPSSGSGTWTGKSSTTACTGRWEAEKRAG